MAGFALPTETPSACKQKSKPPVRRRGLGSIAGVECMEFEASLSELRKLAKTLGFTVTRTFTQKRSGFDSTVYQGVDKRQKTLQFVLGDSCDEAHLRGQVCYWHMTLKDLTLKWFLLTSI